MTKRTIYSWMNKQIKAVELQTSVIDNDHPYYICNASATKGEVHVFNIDNLCKELGISWNVEPHSDEYVKHYISYKGYKFFGLVEKEDNTNEGK